MTISAQEGRDDFDYASYLAQRVDDFESAEDGSDTSRVKAERDIDYYDGKQLTHAELKALEKRGQPPIAFNLVRQKIDYLLGLERTQRTSPNALPRTPKHERDANAATDALRFVKDDNRYAQVRSRSWADIIKAGWGGAEVRAEEVDTREPGRPSHRITIRRCQWDRMFWDPYSSEDDFSDASFLGLVVWMDRKEAVRRYGEKAAQVFDETVSSATGSDSYDDKPKNFTWVKRGTRRRIRVVEMYHIGDDGQWRFCVFTKGGILQSMVSPWLDEFGKPEHPYEWRTSYVDRDNNRFGVIRDLIDPQDEVNKRRSKALHHFTARQTFGTPESAGGMSRAKMRTELAKPDGHVDLPPGSKFGESFGVIPTNDQSQGHFELLQQATEIFSIMGPNAAMQGKGKQDQSGRAILAQQQGGAVQMGPLTDTLKDMDHGVYRKVWNRIRQFWTGETWVRVTDDEQNLKWVGLNKPAMQPVIDPMTGQPAIDPATGQPAMQPVVDPMTGQPEIESPVSELDVDIIIDEAPDVGTLQQEEFAQLVEVAKSGVMPIPPKLLIKASSLRSKGDLLKILDDQEKAQSGPPPELQIEQQKLEMKAQADAQNAQLQAQLKQQESAAEIQGMQARAAAEIEIMRQKAAVEIEIEQMKAAMNAQIRRDEAEAGIVLRAAQVAPAQHAEQ